MVHLLKTEYCKKCGGGDPNCSEYAQQPHYITNAVAPKKD